MRLKGVAALCPTVSPNARVLRCAPTEAVPWFGWSTEQHAGQHETDLVDVGCYRSVCGFSHRAVFRGTQRVGVEARRVGARHLTLPVIAVMEVGVCMWSVEPRPTAIFATRVCRASNGPGAYLPFWFLPFQKHGS